jgi:hypothetical protein
MSAPDTDELIVRFGREIGAFLDRAGKSEHTSSMFDLRRRTLIGSYCYFDHLPWALDILEDLTTPDELGGSGRGICRPVYAPLIHGLLWGYLIARENELGLGRQGGPDESLELVVRWWEGMSRAVRADGSLLPHEAGWTQPSAPTELIAGLLDRHGDRDASEVSHVTATLQIYNYVLHGEQRGTTFFHGPYPMGDGAHAIVEQFTQLRSNELPWSLTPPLPFDSVAAIFELDEDVTVEFDLFQGMYASPTDYLAHARRAALLAFDNPEPIPVSEAEGDELLAATRDEQKRLFREMLRWDTAYRASYAVWHYFDFLVAFLKQAGAPPVFVEEARRRFEQTVTDRLDELLALEEIPVWKRLYARPDPLFSLLGAGTA